MNTTTDPWIDLQIPRNAGQFTARRVDASNPWDFFWAVDHEGKCLMVLHHEPDVLPKERLPRLRDIEIQSRETSDGNMLVFRLLNASHRDIFQRLCLDIMNRAAEAGGEQEAMAVTLARTTRWQYLLRGGADGRLSPEQQKGLIAELLCLEKYFIPAMATGAAVDAWGGPLGHAKDFATGLVGVECKAVRSTVPSSVRMHSEHQLDRSDYEFLFLLVSAIVPAGEETQGFTLTDVAKRITVEVASRSEPAASHFESLLAAAGFLWEHDYTDRTWRHQSSSLYVVGDGFPCLTPSTVPAGVAEIEYTISLPACEPFLASPATLVDLLSQGAPL